jgi:hypothetical protein
VAETAEGVVRLRIAILFHEPTRGLCI